MHAVHQKKKKKGLSYVQKWIGNKVYEKLVVCVIRVLKTVILMKIK